MAIMAMTSSMSDSSYHKGLHEKSEVEKRTKKLLTNTRYEDKYPHIKLPPKIKKKCKTWQQIQEAKRIINDTNNKS